MDATSIAELVGVILGLLLFYLTPIVSFDMWRGTDNKPDDTDASDDLTVENDPYLRDEIRSNVDER